MEIDESPGSQPLALIEFEFGQIELILSSKHAAHTHRMGQRKVGMVKIDGPAMLLRIDKGLSRTEADASR